MACVLATVLREGAVVMDDVYREASARDIEEPLLVDVLRDDVEGVLRDAAELEPEVLIDDVCREASARDILMFYAPQLLVVYLVWLFFLPPSTKAITILS